MHEQLEGAWKFRDYETMGLEPTMRAAGRISVYQGMARHRQPGDSKPANPAAASVASVPL